MKTVTTYPKLVSTYSLLALATVFSVCFVPYFPLTAKLSIRFEDLLLPIVFLSLLPVWRAFKRLYFIVLLSWCLWAILTMAVNNGLHKVNDYFELYKLVKFIVFAVLFLQVFKNKPTVFRTTATFFGLLVVFNLFHYFNLFNFNKLIMPVFCPNKMQLEYFGRNSLGGVATKRILGTMGNPNINGILFLIFNSYFLTFFKRKEWHFAKLLFFASFAMLLFTQSRTSLVAFLVYFTVYISIQQLPWKLIVKMILGLLLGVLIVQLADNLSLRYFSDASFDPEMNTSLRGRWETWKFLWDMIIQKPIFGHGINKNFFYENHIYSENEYLLNIWRYGFPGLFFYLFMVVGLWFTNRQYQSLHFLSQRKVWFLLVTVSVLVSALTNNILANPMLLILFSLTVGAFLSTIDQNGSTINQQL